MSEIKVLDHGYIKLIETWGSDEKIVEAARMSTNKGFLGWGPIHEEDCPKFIQKGQMLGRTFGNECTCQPKPGDERLLRYLYEHKHATPFEMAGMVIEVQAPIFVFREWHRHRTQSYNELSARYIPLPNLNYIPTIERCMINAGTSNKQAGTIKDAEVLIEEKIVDFQLSIEKIYEEFEQAYQFFLKQGIPKEILEIG